MTPSTKYRRWQREDLVQRIRERLPLPEAELQTSEFLVSLDQSSSTASATTRSVSMLPAWSASGLSDFPISTRGSYVRVDTVG